jgi:hypothetical protein
VQAIRSLIRISEAGMMTGAILGLAAVVGIPGVFYLLAKASP